MSFRRKPIQKIPYYIQRHLDKKQADGFNSNSKTKKLHAEVKKAMKNCTSY